MSRTQGNHYEKSNRSTSKYNNPESSFIGHEVKWDNLRKNRALNLTGQFASVYKNQPRTKWDMKGHTF